MRFPNAVPRGCCLRTELDNHNANQSRSSAAAVLERGLRPVYHGYRMAWATHAPRSWDNELSLTFATIAAPNRSTKTASQTNSRQFRAITASCSYGI
jgi:hypothetical protein